MAKQSITLSELNLLVKEQIKLSFPSMVWVRAEISELQENYSGHCYLELVEKDPNTDYIVAKLKANIWANTYRMLKPYFETTTEQRFSAGIKVLICGTVEFHELYGFSFNVRDIDPIYTLGDMARRRMEIVLRLRNEGVMDMNKELELPELANRIAIISSKTAAGYGDFIDQLNNNSQGFKFYCKLFPAIMQGEQTESSIISALDKIYEYHEHFDAVVIIRGGGATADLASFDNYALAYHCTQFPLSIITGIGHQRDTCVLDMVAHTAAKTPTAVAEFLIAHIDEAASILQQMQELLVDNVREILQTEQNRRNMMALQINRLANRFLEQEKHNLSLNLHRINALSKQNLQAEQQHLFRQAFLLKQLSKKSFITKQHEIESNRKQLVDAVKYYVEQQKHQLELHQQTTELKSPTLLLKRGYSITTLNGKVIKDAALLSSGDKITTQLSEGSVDSIVS